MINWKSIFSEPSEEDLKDADDSRKKMLEQLLAANKGMSRLTQAPAETEEEMMSNEDIVKMVSSQIYDKPEITLEDENDDFVDVEEVKNEE